VSVHVIIVLLPPQGLLTLDCHTWLSPWRAGVSLLDTTAPWGPVSNLSENTVRIRAIAYIFSISISST